jgi:hypothetical protein
MFTTLRAGTTLVSALLKNNAGTSKTRHHAKRQWDVNGECARKKAAGSRQLQQNAHFQQDLMERYANGNHIHGEVSVQSRGAGIIQTEQTAMQTDASGMEAVWNLRAAISADKMQLIV